MASIARQALLRHAARASPRSAALAPSTVAAVARRVAVARGGVIEKSTLAAAFHTTNKRNILPPPAQVIQGGVNEAAPVPEPSPSHGSYHWTFERLIAAGLVPLTVAPFAAGSLNPTMDAILCATILIHSHVGFQSVIIDYIPQNHFPGARKLFWWGLRAATLLVGVGLYEFETNDVGVTEAIKRVWRA